MTKTQWEEARREFYGIQARERARAYVAARSQVMWVEEYLRDGWGAWHGQGVSARFYADIAPVLEFAAKEAARRGYQVLRFTRRGPAYMFAHTLFRGDVEVSFLVDLHPKGGLAREGILCAWLRKRVPPRRLWRALSSWMLKMHDLIGLENFINIHVVLESGKNAVVIGPAAKRVAMDACLGASREGVLLGRRGR